MKYKLFFAVLLGIGFTCLVSLAMDFVPSVSLFLSPASIPAALIVHSQNFGPASAVLIGNSLFYALVAFCVLRFYRKQLVEATIRRAMLIAVVPVAVLIGLACDPALDPLWPSKMSDVRKLEADLKKAFYEGMSAEEARRLLRINGIEFSERDNEIFGRSNTGAFEFPCAYEVSVDLIFDSQTGLDTSKLRSARTEEARICP